MIKAVLFDLDGTLLDSAPDLVETLNYLRAGLGLAALPTDELRRFVSHGAAGLIGAGLPPCDEQTMARWREKFLQHYAANSFVRSRPFVGVDPLLAELLRRDIPWGIVTNKLEFLCVPILEQAGWLTAAAVVCGDSVEQAKPHPEPVLAACRKIGVEPSFVLMVGDDRRDMEAGRRAGCRTALALWGYAAMECRSEMTPATTLIHTPAEVLDLLESHGSA